VPIKAVFFDIDGTLVDSNEQHILAWQEALAEIGKEFSHDEIHKHIGKGSDMLIPDILPHLGEEAREQLGKRVGEIFRSRYMADVKPFPAARELLVAVHGAGQKVVLATSASGEERDHYIELLGARDLIDASTSADDVEHTKPAPDVFAAALRKVAPLSADEVIVVGDTPFDVEGASGCGVRAIALRSGRFPEEELQRSGPVRIYDDVADLLREYERSPLSVIDAGQVLQN
jgi:phosphoglycolate phosphatase-like HAD superfamily hydrolase